MRVFEILKYSVVFVLLATVTAGGQELLIGLQENPLLGKQQQAGKNVLRQSAVSLSLPFIDDFSKPLGVYPDQQKWKNKNVFINSSYAVNMPSVGVATFDAIDAKGNLYNVGSAFSQPADTLTSQPINLNYPGDQTIFLSFYYQAGGLGDMPELTDSLVLQFYSPLTSTWKSVWNASVHIQDSMIVERFVKTGTTKQNESNLLPSTFFMTHIRVDGSEYLLDGFQFRFINHASIAVNKFIPGRASNADHWHLDVVYLDRGRSANDVVPDVATSIPQSPLTTIYESIPWTHYNTDAHNALFGDGMKTTLGVFNMGEVVSSVSVFVDIRPLVGNGYITSYSLGQYNTPEIGESGLLPFVITPPYSFYSDNPDSAAFEVITYMRTDNSTSPLRQELRQNDTTRYRQQFYNYYAYDDGSAENGYGLYGSGASAGKVAVKFTGYAADSLRGVYIYFNKTIGQVNASNKIKLAVWEDIGNGTPGQLLYSQAATSPELSDSLNSFVAYKFSKAIAISAKQTYFVGWMQTTEDFVNVGFDRNRDHSENVFYSLSEGVWSPSAYEGSLMIRPIFGQSDGNFPPNPILPPVAPTAVVDVVLSPNPATDVVRLNWKDQKRYAKSAQVEVFDLRGRLVLSQRTANDQLNVSNLPSGTYFMRISSDGKLMGTSKIIIVK